MSAATTISQAFGEGANLYTIVLGLDDDKPTQSQLRKAYYRRALLYHPDKQKQKTKEEKEDAKRKFQAVSLAYAILKDDEKRKEYDQCGEMNDDYEDDDEFGRGKKSGTDIWKDIFASTFGKVTTKGIDEFTQSYKCSEEEEKDVLKYYTMFQGNLDKMLECVMCSDVIDKERWVEDYIKPAIDKCSVEDFSHQIKKSLSNNESSKKKKKSKRKKKAEIEKEKEEGDDEVEIDADDCTNIDEGDDLKCDESSHDASIDSSDKIATDEDKTETEEDQTETEEDSESDSNHCLDGKKMSPVIIASATTSTSTSSKKRKQRPSSTHPSPSTKISSEARHKERKEVMQGRKKKKKKEGAVVPDSDLIAAIRGNSVARRGGEEAFGSFINNLEQRYSSSKTKKKRKNKNAPPSQSDIPDDEFAKIQARLLKKKK